MARYDGPATLHPPSFNATQRSQPLPQIVHPGHLFHPPSTLHGIPETLRHGRYVHLRHGNLRKGGGEVFPAVEGRRGVGRGGREGRAGMECGIGGWKKRNECQPGRWADRKATILTDLCMVVVLNLVVCSD